VFGLTFEKLLIIGLIAVFLLGPDRLPHYAGQLAKLVRNLRNMANGAKDRMRDEMGPEFDEVDWKKLDPRQYDPRRIIREALLDDEDEPRITRPDTSEDRTSEKDSGDASADADSAAGDDASASGEKKMLAMGAAPPFDSEAT
jgi:sec-independent protein translocase protein TatB